MTAGLMRIKKKQKLSHICPTCAIIMKIDRKYGLCAGVMPEKTQVVRVR